MTDWTLGVCKSCKETIWLAESEVVNWVMMHKGHDIYLFKEERFSSLKSIEAIIRELLDWPQRGE